MEWMIMKLGHCHNILIEWMDGIFFVFQKAKKKMNETTESIISTGGFHVICKMLYCNINVYIFV